MITQTKVRGINDVLALLGKVKKIGDKEYEARCPAHDDTIPSLHIRQNENKILLNCKAGCATEDIVRALGLTMADLFLDKEQHLKGEPIATFTYQNPDGSVRFIIKRFPNLPNGKKVFEAYMPDGTKGIGETPRILYRAPEVIKAKEAGETIHVVEGEKDVEALRALGLVATTPPFGASSHWLPEYTDLLKDANVVIIPDTDPPGLKKGNEIAEALQGSVASLKLLKLQGVNDITEWMENGGTVERLVKLVQDQSEYGKLSKPIISNLGDIYELLWEQENIKAEVKNIAENSSGISGEIRISDTSTKEKFVFCRLNFLSDTTKNSLIKRLKEKRDIDWEGILETTSDIVIERHRSGNEVKRKTELPVIVSDPYRVYPIILEGQPTIYYGYGGSLKSYLLMLIALLTHNGISYLGFEPTQGNTLYLDFENDEQTYTRRMTSIQDGLGMGEMDFPLYKDCRGKTLPQLLPEIQKQVLRNNIELAIVDSMTMAAGGYEYEQSIAYFKAIASLGIASVTVDHRAKGLDKGSSPIGAVIKSNIARIVFEVTSEQEPGANYANLTVKNTKNNDNAKLTNKGYRVEFTNTGRITAQVTFVEDEPRTLEDVIKDASTRERLLQHFKHVDNKYETPTEITACTGGTAGANGKYMRRNPDIFEADGNGRWHIKDEVFDLIIQTDKDTDNTP